jgi:hypothetical protein
MAVLDRKHFVERTDRIAHFTGVLGGMALGPVGSIIKASPGLLWFRSQTKTLSARAGSVVIPSVRKYTVGRGIGEERGDLLNCVPATSSTSEVCDEELEISLFPGEFDEDVDILLDLI